MLNQTLRQCGRTGKRVVAQESDDGRQVPQLGSRPIELPIADRKAMNPDVLPRLPLEQFQVDSALTEVVSEGF